MNDTYGAGRHTGDSSDLHGLSGAYAVDALDDVERVRFEAHLAQCADCRAEVAELSATAALLTDDETTPPPALRDAVLSAIDTVRPLPPLVLHDLPAQEPTGPAAAAETTPTTQPAAPTDPAAPTGPAAAAGDDLAARRRTRSFLASRTLLVAASIVLIALVAGTFVVRPWAEDTPTVVPTATERVLDAEDATRVRKEFPDGSAATVVYSPSEARSVILTERMASAPQGQVFQLWLIPEDGAPVSAGLMPDDPDATVLLDGDASQARAVGITVEPDGGSPEPTSDPIAVFALEA